MHTIAAKAVSFKEAMTPEFKEYTKQIKLNARAMVDAFMKRDIKIVSGGTDNHMFLVDLIDKNLTGKEVVIALEIANITTNKNMVPDDPRSPFVTSGVRIGTPAITTRGFDEDDCQQVANWICDIMNSIDDIAVAQRIKEEVLELCGNRPLYE